MKLLTLPAKIKTHHLTIDIQTKPSRNGIDTSNLRVPKIKEMNPRSRLNELDIPVLILYGAFDFDFNRENALELHRLLPESTLQKVKDSGHLINLEQTEVFNTALQSFLK